MQRLNEQNKAAWNGLYAARPELVWGRDPLPFLANWHERFLPFAGRTGEILDAATGEGRNLPFALSLGAPVCASDASAAALAKIPPTVREQVHTVQADLGELPFEDGRFSLILLLDTLETLPAPHEVLRELRRVLRPDGALFVNLPDPGESIAGVEMEDLPEGKGLLYQHRYYFRFFSSPEARTLLGECGLTVLAEGEERWQEAPHPGFRDAPHSHFSHVFLCRPAGSS
ncbi:MAG: class I SAM-dependent methyltransferase [Verrucomicrobiota bacterium JB022]|nr:class I SAM-dependent methyltransferase [Verrucomicrobiota bacterium JB022]